MTNGNDAAFAVVKTDMLEGVMCGRGTYSAGGLTKREWFAGLAMQGLLAFPNGDFEGAHDLAKEAVEHADALIEALNAPASGEEG